MNAAERLLGPHALSRNGSRAAFRCSDETVTFSALAEAVARASGALKSAGVLPGDRVLLLMRDTPEFVAAWLGAVRAGAVAVALNNKISEADYRHILSDSGARLAIIEDRYASARPDLTAELAREGKAIIAGDAAGLPAWRARVQEAAPATAFAAASESPAFLLYSSGTTGRPKGIVHSHGAFASLGGAFRAFGIASGERVFTTSKLFFAYGLEHGMLAPLTLGVTSILYPDWPDVAGVLEVVRREQPAALFSVPTMYRRMLAEPASRLAPLRAVRRFVAGGERLSAQLVEQWKAATGGELLNLYGMSETLCPCIVTPPGTSNGLRTGLGLDAVELSVRNAEGDRVPDGEPGTLWVRHPAQARSYLNLPERSREQFRDGWFCTRDIFVRDPEGFYVHQGRSDELIKIAGQWVQPGELEEVAAQASGVAEAACVPVADADGLERLALFVAVRGDPADAKRSATEACERTLPPHKRPKWVRVVDELPRTATGKIQRFKLREMLERQLSGRD